jgi:hypothetical protein
VHVQPAPQAVLSTVVPEGAMLAEFASHCEVASSWGQHTEVRLSKTGALSGQLPSEFGLTPLSLLPLVLLASGLFSDSLLEPEVVFLPLLHATWMPMLKRPMVRKRKLDNDGM